MTYAPSIGTQNWIDRKVEGLPTRWKRKLRHRWESEVPGGRNFNDKAGQHPEYFANRNLSVWADRLGDSRLPLDASDSDICNAAEKLAGRGFELAKIHHDMKALRAALTRIAQGQDVTPPKAWDEVKQRGVKDGAAVARLTEPLWWRRKLRRVHARLVEGAAIDLGYVNRAQDCYVSRESLWRRAQQNERNAFTMENTILTNEQGQEYTLAELAAKGPADKAIRRAELMTRISGFERIALDMKHIGMFMTKTAPSRMHAYSTVKNDKVRVYKNKRYDGTQPHAAQARHGEVWARIRSKCNRYGIPFYGFRIAEPNHDGTPHWHLLIFLDPNFKGDPSRDAVRRFCAIVRRYALGKGENDKARKDETKVFVRDGFQFKYQAQAAHRQKMSRWDVAERARQNSEPGAKLKRVDFKPIDTGRGSAAGYIAKYVSKNIDGYRLDTDLFGNDGVTASHAVEAWAATHSIRQFQQVGGPPVGPWRELRRIKELPTGAPKHLIDAHHAVNKITNMEAGTVKSVAWDRYVKAQGGVFCGRRARIKIAKTRPEGKNRYGEEAAERPFGVETVSFEQYAPEWNPGMVATRAVHWIVESDRHVWTITRPGASSVPAPGPKAPWTCVNNCTDTTGPQAEIDDENEALRLDALRGAGEFRGWKGKPTPEYTNERPNDHQHGPH